MRSGSRGLRGIVVALLATVLGAGCVALCGCGGGGNGAGGRTDAGSSATGSDAGNATDASSGAMGSDVGSAQDAANGSEASNGGDAADVGVPATPGSCAPDPLHTGLTAQQTGVSVDAFDCQILKWTASYTEPDPMVFKAIIYVESRFDYKSVACPNLPCGTPSGWTAAESGCYGLMQVVPACGGAPNNAGLLLNGHPNLTTVMSSSGWAGSIFNPDVNIEIGIAGVAGNRAQVVKQFPGCTVDQYTMMAIGNYNSYGSTKSCTVYNTGYDNAVITAYQQYATAAGYAAHKY
jgi:hypothetical protein